MKILVIGSRGFIGSHCVDYFSQNHEVWGCDVVIDFNDPRYMVINAEDSDYTSMFEQHQFDVCINCSGAANVPFSLEKPYFDFSLNTLNVLKMLEAIRKHAPHCKFITMSSAAIYGNPKSLPICENAEYSPVSPYGYHKTMAEMICREFSTFWGVKTCCLRIFSAFGPRLKKQLFWDMYNKFTKQNSITLWGTGKESRDFIYVDDIIRIIDLAITHSKFDGECVNVANGKQETIESVAAAFVKLLNSSKPVAFNNEVRKGDPLNWEANIDTIKSWGYQQSVTLENGIKNYILWIKEQK